MLDVTVSQSHHTNTRFGSILQINVLGDVHKVRTLRINIETKVSVMIDLNLFNKVDYWHTLIFGLRAIDTKILQVIQDERELQRIDCIIYQNLQQL